MQDGVGQGGGGDGGGGDLSRHNLMVKNGNTTALWDPLRFSVTSCSSSFLATLDVHFCSNSFMFS